MEKKPAWKVFIPMWKAYQKQRRKVNVFLGSHQEMPAFTGGVVPCKLEIIELGKGGIFRFFLGIKT